MSPTNGRSSGPFRVVASEMFRQGIQRALAEAVEAGTAERFLASLRIIQQRLQADPFAFGEPKYRLPALNLHVRQGAVHPLIVYYAVHEERRLVFVRSFKVLS